jgi:hypothetical protein
MNPVNLATARRTFLHRRWPVADAQTQREFRAVRSHDNSHRTTVMLAQHRSHVEVYHFATGLEAKRQPQALA